MIVKLCRFLTHVFFSSVTVLDPDRIPAVGPVLVVANHHSALIDPMVLLAEMERQPRFLSKATLWQPRYLPLRPFLNAAKAVPVHRAKDGGGDNSRMFEATRKVLYEGGVVAVFGEGVSHNTPGLQQMKTGPARIALGTTVPVTVVPVGLIFPDRPRYRSSVTVAVGAPIEVHGSEGGDDDRDAVKALTQQLADGLRAVAPTWERQDDQVAAYAAARVVAARDGVPEGVVLNRINRSLDANDAVAADVLARSKDLLDECEHLDLDLQLVVDDPANLGALARTSYLKALLWAVPTIVGHIINYPAYLAVDRFARRNDYNFQATAKILAGIFAYPIWWLIIFAATWWWFSLPWALAAAVAAIVGGYVAGEKMRLLKTTNSRMEILDSDRDLSTLEQRFHAVAAAYHGLRV